MLQSLLNTTKLDRFINIFGVLLYILYKIYGKKKIQTLPLTELVRTAVKDTTANQVVQWLGDAKERVLSGKGYPSQAELDEYRLTPFGFLLLSELVNAYPGGGANNLTPAVIKYQLEQLDKKRMSNAPIEVLLGIHGSISPIFDIGHGKIIGGFEVSEELERSISNSSPGFINALNSHHAHASCGLSEGSTPYLREKLGKIIQNMIDLEEIFPELTVQPLEALIGQKTKYYFNFSNNRDIGFYLHPNSSPSNDSLEIPKGEKLLTYEDINAKLRGSMDKGHIIIGSVCLDSRMGATLPHRNVKEIELSEFTNYNTFWQNTRHTEFPIGTFLTGENDKYTTMLAYYLQTHNLALAQESSVHYSKFVAPSRVPLISFPADLLKDEKVSKEFASQMFRLGSNLVHEIYQSGFVFGKDIGRKSTRGYILTEDGLRQVEYTDGLHIMFPDTKIGHNLAELRVVHPLLQNVTSLERKYQCAMVRPNPPINRYYPGSKQPIGRVISEYF